MKVLESLASGWYHRNDAAVLRSSAGQSRHEYEGGRVSTTSLKDQGKDPIPPQQQQQHDNEPGKSVGNAPDSPGDAAAAGGAAAAESKERPVLRTLHTMEMLSNSSHCPANLSETDIETTLVVQSSLDRIWILAETCLRWSDPIVAIVAIQGKEGGEKSSSGGSGAQSDRRVEGNVSPTELDCAPPRRRQQYTGTVSGQRAAEHGPRPSSDQPHLNGGRGLCSVPEPFRDDSIRAAKTASSG